MGRPLSGLGIFTKWLIIPAALAATGYYFIGPKIGGDIIPARLKPVPEQPKPAAQTAQAADNSDPTPTKTYAEPEVTVQAQPAGRIHRPSDSRRHRKKKKKKSVVAPPADGPVNPPDDGGSGGAATAGGTGGGTGGDTGGGTTGGATTGGTDGG